MQTSHVANDVLPRIQPHSADASELRDGEVDVRPLGRVPISVLTGIYVIGQASYLTWVRRGARPRWPEIERPRRYWEEMSPQMQTAVVRIGGCEALYRSLRRLEVFGAPTALAIYSRPDRGRQGLLLEKGVELVSSRGSTTGGTLVIAPHIGPMMSVILSLRGRGRTVALVAHRPTAQVGSRIAQLERILALPRTGQTVLLDSTQPVHVLESVGVLRKGGVVVWAPDFIHGYGNDGRGLECRLLGREFRASPVVLHMAARTNSDVVLAVSRLNRRKPRINVEYQRLELCPAEDLLGLSDLYEKVEQVIVKNIDQWTLWKTWFRSYDPSWFE